jgi:phosphoribosylformylglycinamidine cyclo-ligase
LQAVLYKDNWERPAIFDFLQAQGQISDFEMHRVFNCGIGMVIVINKNDLTQAKALLSSMGEVVYELGHIVNKPAGQASTVVL